MSRDQARRRRNVTTWEGNRMQAVKVSAWKTAKSSGRARHATCVLRRFSNRRESPRRRHDRFAP
jgi:hypothetical protein